MLYPAYEARMLRRCLPHDRLPKHIGVMLDGNRRWAKAVGRDTAHGHRAGAANIEPLLGWCDEVGIEVVTLWLLSTDNLNRPAERAAPLLGDHRRGRRLARRRSGAGGSTRSAPSTCCPRRPPRRSRRPRRRPATSTGCWSTSPSGTAGGARSPTPYAPCCSEHAGRGHLDRGARRDHRRRAHRRAPLHQGPARPRPGDPHLRRAAAGRVPAVAERAVASSTSARRYWPDFRRVDFLRALRAYAERERRFGT